MFLKLILIKETILPVSQSCPPLLIHVLLFKLEFLKKYPISRPHLPNVGNISQPPSFVVSHLSSSATSFTQYHMFHLVSFLSFSATSLSYCSTTSYSQLHIFKLAPHVSLRVTLITQHQIYQLAPLYFGQHYITQLLPHLSTSTSSLSRHHIIYLAPHLSVGATCVSQHNI